MNSSSNQTRTCILVNSCQKYSYILHPFFIMWKRWWKDCDLPMFLACDGNLHEFREEYDINTIEQEEDYGFVEGRVHALKKLEQYDNVIMLQDDFIIERNVDNKMICLLIDIMNKEKDIACIRLMPCPGPSGKYYTFNNVNFREFKEDSWCRFSYQASLWNRKYYIRFFEELIDSIKTNIYNTYSSEDSYNMINNKSYWNYLWVRVNIAESPFARTILNKYPEKLLGVIRDGDEPNAVYRSPIPYRPTAIVKGKLEEWAKELFKREGINIT